MKTIDPEVAEFVPQGWPMSDTSGRRHSAILPSFARAIAGRWWVHLLRGLAAIGFAIFAFLSSQMTLLTLLFLYGAFALLDGLVALVGAIAGRAASSATWLLAVDGILGILVGGLTLAVPGLLAVGLLVYVGGWAMIRGAIDILL